MIYGFGLWDKVQQHLQKELPQGSIKCISDFNKMKQIATKDDLVFFLRFGKGAMNLLADFHSNGINTYPNQSFSLFISKRNDYLKEFNEFTKYPLKRIYAKI